MTKTEYFSCLTISKYNYRDLQFRKSTYSGIILGLDFERFALSHYSHYNLLNDLKWEKKSYTI